MRILTNDVTGYCRAWLSILFSDLLFTNVPVEYGCPYSFLTCAGLTRYPGPVIEFAAYPDLDSTSSSEDANVIVIRSPLNGTSPRIIGWIDSTRSEIQIGMINVRQFAPTLGHNNSDGEIRPEIQIG